MKKLILSIVILFSIITYSSACIKIIEEISFRYGDIIKLCIDNKLFILSLNKLNNARGIVQVFEIGGKSAIIPADFKQTGLQPVKCECNE